MRMLTTGQIASELGVPVHRVLYVLRSRELKADAKAGHYRLYGEKVLEEVRRELSSIGELRVKEGRDG